MTDDGARDDGRQPDVRLADADREAAIAALAVHRDAGRLSGVEYEDRWALAREARVAGDLGPVFADLPAPHSVSPSAPSAGPAPRGDATPATTERGPSAMGLDAGKLVALMPILALVLFFVTDSWLWFLLIPVAGIIFGSTHQGRNRNRS